MFLFKVNRLRSFLIKLPILSLAFLLLCAPIKGEVTDQDLARALEYVASQRIATALQSKDDKKPLSDWELFHKSCEIFRLDAKKALALLESKNPELYKSIKASE